MNLFRVLGAIIDFNIKYFVFIFFFFFIVIGEISFLYSLLHVWGVPLILAFAASVYIFFYKFLKFGKFLYGVNAFEYYSKELREFENEKSYNESNNRSNISKGSKLTDIERDILLKEARAKGLLQ